MRAAHPNLKITFYEATCRRLGEWLRRLRCYRRISDDMRYRIEMFQGVSPARWPEAAGTRCKPSDCIELDPTLSEHNAEGRGSHPRQHPFNSPRRDVHDNFEPTCVIRC